MLSKSNSLNATQIKIPFVAAFDFNQLIHTVCSLTAPPRPTDLDPFPAPPHRFLALPLPAAPRPEKKIASPSIPDL